MRRLARVLVAAVLPLGVPGLAALVGAGRAVADESSPDTTVDQAPFDQEFSRGYYLIHLLGTNTMDGYVEKDSYLLNPEAPVDGWFLTPDGQGGTFNNRGDSLGGPFTTPRQVCAAARGTPQQYFSVEGRDFDCRRLASSGGGGGGGIGMPGIIGLAAGGIAIVVGAPIVVNSIRNRPKPPQPCPSLEELRKVMAEYERADALIQEIGPKLEAADHYAKAPAVINDAHQVLARCEFSVAQYEARQTLYSYTFGWCETAQSVAGGFLTISSIGLGFSGAIGWHSADATGKWLTRLFIRLGIAGNKVKSIAGLSSVTGATLFGVISAANYFGPKGRAELAALKSALAETQRQLAAYESQVTPILESAEQARRLHGAERLTVADQEQRRARIEALRLQTAAQCPGVEVPSPVGLPEVRGLSVGWQGRWETPVMGAR